MLGQEYHRSRDQEFYDLLAGYAAYLVASWTFLFMMLTQAGAEAWVWATMGVVNTLTALYYSDEIADFGRRFREETETGRTGSKTGERCNTFIKSSSMGNETPVSDHIELVDSDEYDLFTKYGLGENGDKNEQQGENYAQ